MTIHDQEHLSMMGHMLFFSQLACSHMAHDLASPIGAVTTGLEMFECANIQEDQQEVLDLVEKSAQSLRYRLDMFRAVYASGGQTIGVRYGRTITQQYFSLYERLTLNWDPCFDHMKFEKGSIQLLLNVLMWLGTKAPKGGILNVCLDEASQTMEVRLKSPMLFVHESDISVLNGNVPLEELQPQMAQAYMVFLLSTVLGYPFKMHTCCVEEIHMTINVSPLNQCG